jgi:two-component system OmpR family response regulator
MINTQPKTILIVDSDQDMCWLLKKVLKQRNCQLIESDSWENTIYMTSQKKPDLVLLDMPLNNISITNILSFIKSLHANTQVIIITPCITDKLLKEIKLLPNCKLISKPFVIENLIMMVKQTLC